MKTGHKVKKSVDEKIKHCLSCNRCWERNWFADRSWDISYKFLFYENFVTYGKKKVTCPVCASKVS